MKTVRILFRCFAALVLGPSSVLGAQSGAIPTVVARQVRILEAPFSSPMFMPTDIAVSPSGRVFTADGVNDRIVEFDADGDYAGEITQIGTERLSRPIGIDVDSQGNLWIADTGNHRVFARGADGGHEQMIALPSDDGEHASEITDVVVSSGGRYVWLVDNENHRLLRFEPASSTFASLGGRGDGVGQFQFPFLAAGDSGDGVFVTDVVNGRIQVVRDLTVVPRTIGRYGVQLSQLYRPKGIATDPAGNVWVVDGTLGVIQVFSPDGPWIGVARDEAGNIFRLEAPCGIAFAGREETDEVLPGGTHNKGDHDPRAQRGYLYVTTLAASHVVKLEVEIRPGGERVEKATISPPRHRQPATCTACHLEWMPSFAERTGNLLADPPPVSVEEPFVSRSGSCLSCHDGSVVDSRRSVWRDHGHLQGWEIPKEMSVPNDLPLVDGRLTCRTCHSAHSRGGAGHSLEDAVFLRVDNQADELCVRCHSEYSGGAEFGNHPTSGFAKSLPAERLTGEVRQGSAAASCLVCHAGHGSKHAALLHLSESTNSLCLSCHALTEGGSGHGIQSVHPMAGELNEEQFTAMERLKSTTVSPSLECLSCHQVHHARNVGFLLRASLGESSLCLQCHREMGMIIATPHDLRQSAPKEINAYGATAEQQGPCSACHTVHRPAEAAAPTQSAVAGDRCTTCHQPGGCAQARTGEPLSHPISVEDASVRELRAELESMGRRGPSVNAFSCATCHNPHDTSNQHFLRADKETLCVTCHATHDSLAGSAHDFTERPDLTNARNQTAQSSGRCGFCHAVHGALGSALWVATREAPRRAKDLCQECHGDSTTSAKNVALLHPAAEFVQISRIAANADLPLFAESGSRDENGALSCATCHDVHGNSRDSQPLLRGVTSADKPGDLCVECHQEMVSLAASFHDQAHVSRLATSHSTCGPCHAVHAPPETQRRDTWTGPLGAEGEPPTVRRCTGCHSTSGGLSDVAYYRHLSFPRRESFWMDDAGGFPLVDRAVPEGAVVEIGCVTCHTPHGRLPSGGFVEVDDRLAAPLQHARKPMLRPYVAPNLCSDCHGMDGLRLFLNFHKIARGQ